MNIYEEDGAEGVIDLHAAKHELSGVNRINNESARRQALAELTAGALLDIAASLRVVAADARIGLDDFAAAVDGGEGIPEETPDDFLVVGDSVVFDGNEAKGEILSFGFTEGSQIADIRWEDGTISKAWTDRLTRIVSETDDESGDDGYEPTGIITTEDHQVMPDDIEPPVEDDIDSDFDGDAHPAAASALELLERNEAERKAKKKGSKK